MIQEQLFSALSGVAGGRVFPNVAPNNVAKPYVVYSRVASTPENTLADGVPVENTRIQIDCLDTTYAAVISLAEAVKAARGKAVGDKLSQDTALAVGNTRAEFEAFIKQEQARWKPVIARAKIQPEGV